MTKTFAQPAYSAWIIPPTNSDVHAAWSFTSFVPCPRLIPQMCSFSAGGTVDSASFTVLSPTAVDSRGGPLQTVAGPEPTPGSYVMIARSAPATEDDGSFIPPEVDDIVWFGVLSSVDFALVDDAPLDAVTVTSALPLYGDAEAIGIQRALFDTYNITTSAQKEAPYTAAGVRFGQPPSANTRSDHNVISGNGTKIAIDGVDAYVFTADSADNKTDPVANSGSFWTRWRLLTHLARFCAPQANVSGWARLIVVTDDGSGFDATTFAPVIDGGTPGTLHAWLNAASPAVSWDINDTAISQAISTICGDAIGWRLELRQTDVDVAWAIVLYSRAAATPSASQPPRPAARAKRLVDHPQLADVSFAADDEPVYDKVTVQGAHCVFGATLSARDGSLVPSWGGTAPTYAVPSYNSASPQQRTSGQFGDVYQLFRAKKTGSPPTLTVAKADGTKSDTLALPSVYFDQADGTATVQNDTPVACNLQALSFCEYVPWQAGRPYNDARMPFDAQHASMLPPSLYEQSSSDNAKFIPLTAFDQMASDDAIPQSPSVAFSTGLAVRVTYNPPHTLAKGTYTGIDADQSEVDWRMIHATVGITSPQRLSVSRVNPASNLIRDELIVTDESLRFLACIGGTIMGLSATATAQRLADTTIVVNDGKTAAAMVDALAEWAFSPRHTAVFSTTNALQDSSPWVIGDMVLGADVSGTSVPVGGCVGSISMDFKSGRTTVRTEHAPRPGFTPNTVTPTRGNFTTRELEAISLPVKPVPPVAKVTKATLLAQEKAGLERIYWRVIRAKVAPISLFGLGGVMKITTVIDTSTFPDNVSDVVADGVCWISPNTISSLSLPHSMGVAESVSTTNSSKQYRFVINDANAVWKSFIPVGATFWSDATIDIPVVRDGVTYMYPSIWPINIEGW